MMLTQALDRTLLLMRGHLVPEATDASLLAALTGTTAVLVADGEALRAHSAQCAFVTTALLLARSGHSVHLLAPDVSIIGPQPPLRMGGTLISRLLEIGEDLLPGVAFRTDFPQTGIDVAILIGGNSFAGRADRIMHLSAARWMGSLSSRRRQGWQEPNWPFGAFSAAGLAASEVYKIAMRKLRAFAANPIFDAIFAAKDEAEFAVAPDPAPTVSDLGQFDCISGGAITNSLLYALARIPNVLGSGRVIEPDTGDLTNLNRYALMRRSRISLRKAEDLATQALGGLKISTVFQRYDPATRAGLMPHAPAVLVGVDHIPSRWEAQKARPRWLGIGATEMYQAVTSFHTTGLGCAGCANPRFTSTDDRIPTVAFVSFFAGLMLAALFVRHAAGEVVPESWQQTTFFPLRGGDEVWRDSVPLHPACPVGHKAIQIQSAAE